MEPFTGKFYIWRKISTVQCRFWIVGVGVAPWTGFEQPVERYVWRSWIVGIGMAILVGESLCEDEWGRFWDPEWICPLCRGISGGPSSWWRSKKTVRKGFGSDLALINGKGWGDRPISSPDSGFVLLGWDFLSTRTNPLLTNENSSTTTKTRKSTCFPVPLVIDQCQRMITPAALSQSWGVPFFRRKWRVNLGCSAFFGQDWRWIHTG